MKYTKTIEYLYNQHPDFQRVGVSAYKEGLDNSLALDKLFDYPHTKFKTIHVGGTNGKGSTSHTLAAILEQSGYKVGLFTSPHLVDFRERIRINGEKISKEYIVDFVNTYKADFEPIKPSFFELTMMIAFKYFADEKVDVAIIEVGLGGRLDSTNIITPDLSIITNISKDHTQFLGDTLEKIAIEKAGIIKKNVPVIIGEAQNSIRQIFNETADRVGTSIIFAEDQNLISSSIKTASGWLFLTRDFGSMKGELRGLAQQKNASTILTAINVLQQKGYHISTKAVQSGFAYVMELTGLQGRWQILQQHPRVICDTAHNEGGIKYIVEQLATERYNKLHFIIGMAGDKDASAVIHLLPQTATYYFTKADSPRSLCEVKLQEIAMENNLQGKSYTSIKEAINKAREQASINDLIFIGGSNFVVAEALEYFDK